MMFVINCKDIQSYRKTNFTILMKQLFTMVCTLCLCIDYYVQVNDTEFDV